MKERIKELRRLLKLTQNEFAKKIGVKQSTIATYESGRNEPTYSVIKSICREYSVSEDWLRSGKGSIFLPDISGTVEALAYEYGLTPEEKVLVEQFVRLSKPYREAVLVYFQNVVDAMNGLKDDTEAAEAAYREALGFVLPEESSASNTSDDIRMRRETGERKEPYEEEKESV